MNEEVFSCARKCIKLKAPVENNESRYKRGVKRCGNCGGGIFIRTNKFRCPCCGERLRSKAKNSKNREQFGGY